MMQNRAGYTLIELVLTMAIIAALLGISLTAYRPLYLRNELDVATHMVVLNIYSAESLSRSSAQDSNWGIHIVGSSLTLYRGTSYALRVLSSDETTTIPSIVSVSGSTDYNFTRLSGTPAATGTTTLSVTGSGSNQLTMNAKGVVDY